MEIRDYLLENAFLRLRVCDLGAAMLSLQLRRGDVWQEVLAGEKDLAWRAAHHPYYSAIVGPVANRIAGAAFTLAGQSYTLEANEAGHHLHGGSDGCHTARFQLLKQEPEELRLFLERPDGQGGYPGPLRIEVTYSLKERDTLLSIRGEAGGKATLWNPSSHNYFCLDQSAGNILAHRLCLPTAAAFTAVDNHLIPTGEILPVEGSALDLRERTLLGERLANTDEVRQFRQNFDHSFVLGTASRTRCGLPLAAVLEAPRQKLRLELATDAPGLQVYTCKEGGSGAAGPQSFPPYFACCLEPQSFPDAVHHPSFPSIVLPAGSSRTRQILYHLEEMDSASSL